MIGRRWFAAPLLGALSVLLLADPSAAAGPIPPPSSMASLGDSITRGFNACGFGDCTARSFSTGTYATVNSHYLRILRVSPAINAKNYNDAKTGATSADLVGQAQKAVGQQVGYITILIGANDACTSSESTMTPVATFRSRIDAGLAALKSGLPNSPVQVLSVPDIKRLWEVGHGKAAARSAWALFGICRSMLANANSTKAADVARRDRVRQRVIDFNTQLAQACAAYGPNCVFDNNAVFSYPFTLGQLSTLDYFHPNASGQTALAGVSYVAGYNW